MASSYVAIEVDRDMPSGDLQITVVHRDTGGNAELHQLAGPDYTGRSHTVMSHRLSTADAKQIRAYLDAVFPVSVETPSPFAGLTPYVAWFGSSTTPGQCMGCQQPRPVHLGYNGGQPMNVTMCSTCQPKFMEWCRQQTGAR